MPKLVVCQDIDAVDASTKVQLSEAAASSQTVATMSLPLLGQELLERRLEALLIVEVETSGVWPTMYDGT